MDVIQRLLKLSSMCKCIYYALGEKYIYIYSSILGVVTNFVSVCQHYDCNLTSVRLTILFRNAADITNNIVTATHKTPLEINREIYSVFLKLSMSTLQPSAYRLLRFLINIRKVNKIWSVSCLCSSKKTHESIIKSV
jgi:hypothetical protein